MRISCESMTGHKAQWKRKSKGNQALLLHCFFLLLRSTHSRVMRMRTVNLRHERDVVLARQRARQIAGLRKFDVQE